MAINMVFVWKHCSPQRHPPLEDGIHQFKAFTWNFHLGWKTLFLNWHLHIQLWTHCAVYFLSTNLALMMSEKHNKSDSQWFGFFTKWLEEGGNGVCIRHKLKKFIEDEKLNKIRCDKSLITSQNHQDITLMPRLERLSLLARMKRDFLKIPKK